jgi:cysteinyl-tRNA synthetase
MSKSLGNFFTVREVLARYRAEEVRYFLLSSHYRSPLNYSADMLAQARAALQRLYLALRGLPDAEPAGGEPEAERFAAAMDDDFNTPLALATLFDVAREVNRLRETDTAAAAGLAARLRELAGVLGLLRQPVEDYLKGAGEEQSDDADIDALVAERDEARRVRDFARADRIRDELQSRGVVLEDSAAGTTWRRG